MPIPRALVEQLFDPEQARAIGLAFEHACHSLGLTDIPDRLTDLVAGKIIETAKTGESDPDRLYEAVMRWASSTASAA